MGNRDFRKLRHGAAAAALWLAAAGVGAAQACDPAVAQLKGDWGQARFAVEVADDATERARGLMDRTHMPSGSGMLFVYDRPQRVAFWMRNTLIPLDMIFLDATGTVRRVHHRAVPLDETPIDGGDGVFAVLEINGGLAERVGIAEGSVMRHPAFAAPDAAWPCAD
ncbi:DUF192 domain-containing protein [Actibacterium ureilyticum]|uniref:DUF192 domain-containing protein n=1 Tax=Actibacterium ureilyticum TaxID=1590614 RepID=UPI000BAB0B6F|nr:DUF192 domain-containing protein [Actibacterium ureilyticum]